jgi:hypothetical protein
MGELNLISADFMSKIEKELGKCFDFTFKQVNMIFKEIFQFLKFFMSFESKKKKKRPEKLYLFIISSEFLY